jgi:DNA-binding NtrC family response regulator
VCEITVHRQHFPKIQSVYQIRVKHTAGSPVGDTASRQFRGKLIAATNRDLAAGIRDGRFREDLYYRLCSDQITTPSLSEQLAESPGVIHELIAYMARRVAGAEAEDLAFEVLTGVDEHLGSDYPWPGNYRELEQCVKNVLIRRDYQPSRPKIKGPIERSVQEFRTGTLTAEQLLSRYCTIVYRQTGSYEETARRLQIDRRTVESKVDVDLLAKLSVG